MEKANYILLKIDLLKWSIVVLFFFSFPIFTSSSTSNSHAGNTADSHLDNVHDVLRLKPRADTNTSTTTMTSTTTNSTTTLPDSNATACTSGSKLGYYTFTSPGYTSTVTVGQPFNISWTPTSLVTSPPKFFNIRLQLILDGVPITWSTVVVNNYPVDSSPYVWNPQAFADGNYQLRLVPDGKENFQTNPTPCYPDGSAVPSISSVFSMVNAGTLSTFNDPLPPNSGSMREFNSFPLRSMWFQFILIVIMLYIHLDSFSF